MRLREDTEEIYPKLEGGETYPSLVELFLFSVSHSNSILAFLCFGFCFDCLVSETFTTRFTQPYSLSSYYFPCTTIKHTTKLRDIP